MISSSGHGKADVKRLEGKFALATTMLCLKLLKPKQTRAQSQAKAPLRNLSASARKRMSLEQKARWAKRAANVKAGTARPRSTMSAAGRERIAAAQRARWARVKAQQK
jgi:hypothetical protein